MMRNMMMATMKQRVRLPPSTICSRLCALDRMIVPQLTTS